MEAKRLADAHGLADRQRARVLVGADEPAHQVVAAAVLGAVLVDHQAGQDAAARGQPLLLLRERAELAAEPLERGFPASSSTTFSSALVTTESLPTGSQPCETTVRTARSADDGATAPSISTSPSRKAPGPGLGRARREPADDRHLALDRVQLREEGRGRERERVGEQEHEIGVVERRHAPDGDALVRAEGDRVEGLDLAAREPCGPDGDARALLELAVAAEHALRHAADQARRLELGSGRLESVLRIVEVVGREEEAGQVGAGPAERLACLSRRLGACRAASAAPDNPAPTRHVSVSGLMANEGPRAVPRRRFRRSSTAARDP